MSNPTAQIIFEGDADKLLAELRKVERGMGGVQSVLGSVRGALGILTAAFTAFKSAEFVLELRKAGDELGDLQTNFKRLALNSEADLETLRRAVKGTVSDVVLLREASRALESGLDLTAISAIMEFASSRAQLFGDTFDQVFQQVFSAVKSQSPAALRTLRQFGIEAKDVGNIIDQISAKNDEQRATVLATGLSWDQFTAQLANEKAQFGAFINEILEPFAAVTSQILSNIRGINAAPLQVPNASPTPRQTFTLPAGLSNTASLLATLPDDKAAEEIKKLLNEMLLKAVGTKAELQAQLDILKLQEQVLRLRDASVGDILANQVQQKALQQQISDIEATAQDTAQKTAADAIAADKQRLINERELVKAKIANGQATYAELKAVIAAQQSLYLDDKQFQIGLIQDLAAIRSNDQQQEINRQSEVLNATRRFTDAIMQDERRSYAQRLVDRLDVLNRTMELETLDINHRRELYAEQQQAEAELTQFIRNELEQRVQIMQQIFGNTFLTVLDDILDGSVKRFDQYLAQLGKAILRFLASQALLRLFSLIAGGIPIPGLGGLRGLSGGSGNFDFGVTSAGGSSALPLSAAILGNIGRSVQYIQQVNQQAGAYPVPQVQVQLLANDRQLYAIVKNGEHRESRTKLY